MIGLSFDQAWVIPESMTREQALATNRRVLFSLPRDGWMQMLLVCDPDIIRIGCTHLADPFKNMLAWLEEITETSKPISWAIAEEGGTSVLTYVPRLFLGDEFSGVIVSQTGVTIRQELPLSRSEVVSTFYGAFRRMADDGAYAPREWEAAEDWRSDNLDLFADALTDVEMTEADTCNPYDGFNLRKLRSRRLEALLPGS